jgi:penicillin G amidase
MKLQAVVEEIEVRNAKTFYDTVYYSHYGPVVFDDNFEGNANKSYAAMQWIAHRLSYEAITFKKLLKARNYPDFREAIKDFSTPPQTLSLLPLQEISPCTVREISRFEEKTRGSLS